MIAYHAVTERPMHAGQRLSFDEQHPTGVCRRVMEKAEAVRRIYAHPCRCSADALEHHTSAALRELALEEVRLARYPQYPSRMACLYASKTLDEAERWAAYFVRLGRPVYGIVRIDAQGPVFEGNANLCFSGKADHSENLRLAQRYWENRREGLEEPPVRELLCGGEIAVLEVVREIGANLPSGKSGETP